MPFKDILLGRFSYIPAADSDNKPSRLLKSEVGSHQDSAHFKKKAVTEFGKID